MVLWNSLRVSVTRSAHDREFPRLLVGELELVGLRRFIRGLVDILDEPRLVVARRQ